MNDAQQRRQDLLVQTRKLYSDKGKIPAVHPRYGTFGINHESKAKTEENIELSYLKLRFLIAVLLMVIYAGVDYTDTIIGGYTSHDVVEAVSQNIDVAQVWNSL